MINSNIKALQEALKVSPENIPLLLMLGEAYLGEKDQVQARKAFDEILTLDSQHLEARLGVVKTLILEKKYSEGFVRTEDIVKDNKECGPAWILLSRIHALENNIPEAKKCYERAIKLDGSLADSEMENNLYLSQKEPSTSRLQEPLAHGESFTPHSQSQPVNEKYWSQREKDGKGFLDPEIGQMEKPNTTFADVGGMEGLKEEIRMKIMYPLENPDLFRTYGKQIGGGVLIYGPPGCGKTLISKATAGEIKAKFISVGIHEILDLWIGNSEKNMHQLFELARADAPSVLFFDEVDALAADRKHLKHSGTRSLINQFLAEMDGTQGQNDGVLVIGATNAPWHIDPAFRRPGRFDRMLFVPPPDLEARKAIVQIMAQGKPIKDLEASLIAKKTAEFSGADLKSIFDITIEQTLAAAMKEGKIVPITTKNLLRTLKGLKPSTRAWFESARNYALYSNQNGVYDEILAYLGIKK